MYLNGSIVAYDGKKLTVEAPYEDVFTYIKKQLSQCEIRLDDGRTISADQRKKIYATFRDISLYTGHPPEEIKAIMKYEYIVKTGSPYFSLSDVDMTTAREFLEFLIEWCVEWDIPTSDCLVDRSPDVARYLYCCLIHKKCCITGQKAELHHVDVVGGGRNRKEIVHKGMRVLPLTRKLHTEAHTIGQPAFDRKYHVFGIKLDDDLCRIWRLKS